jgi:AraC-like DNA-binding protein/mannose-6-phosphate isomerase-like protein (cupin superfamily)
LTEFDPKPGVAVATLAYEYPSGFEVSDHAHGSDQLIYAISGIMEVFSGQSVWLIPPHFALWIPARTRHRIRMPGPVSMRTLYLRTGLTARSEQHCAVLHVTPLLRELIVEAVRVSQLRVRNRYECALRDLLIAHLQKASPIPTFVTLPRETRALAVAQAILRNPAESKTMAALCAEAGVSVRTIERVFRDEIGSNFESWRRQVRLTKAVELLVAGFSIKEVAHKVGYSQSSAFVELFRRTFGTTPKAWISALENLGQQSTEPRANLPLAPQRSVKP